MIESAIKKVCLKENLDIDTAKTVMDEIMSGKASSVQIASYLTAMAIKGETVEEITASAQAMREHCAEFKCSSDVMEIVGTGGDKSNSFNISTASAIVVSSLGVPVAKHGNRAASSKCGAADVLEALGVNIEISPEASAKILDEIGICFLFAQSYHKAMKYVAPVRKELGIRTIFNVLGPLANPARAKKQLLGVYSKELVVPMTKVLYNLGCEKAVAVFGNDGIDEVSMSANTTVCTADGGNFTVYEISPKDFGLAKCSKDDIKGGEPKENAQIIIDIFNGKSGAKSDAVALNSGAALYTAGKVVSIADGVKMAQEAIKSGVAKKQLERFIELSKELA